VRAPPHERTDLEALEASFLGKLAAKRLLVRLAGIDTASRCRPPGPLRELEAHEEHMVVGVEDDCANCGPQPKLTHRARLAMR
jgi:hypothetical protein